MESYKMIVAGSRTLQNQMEAVHKAIMEAIERIGRKPEYIISGTAQGIDTLGEIWAEAAGIKTIKMPANWEKYGKSAGYKRNGAMAQIGNCLVLIWDGKSRGSLHMKTIAQKKGIRIFETIIGENK